MTLAEKLEYGGLYSEFANNEVHRLDERAAWLELAAYDGATELDHQDLMQLQELITRARQRLSRMTSNEARFMKRAAAIGIRPVPDPRWPTPDLGQICRPMLAEAVRLRAECRWGIFRHELVHALHPLRTSSGLLISASRLKHST